MTKPGIKGRAHLSAEELIGIKPDVKLARKAKPIKHSVKDYAVFFVISALIVILVEIIIALVFGLKIC